MAVQRVSGRARNKTQLFKSVCRNVYLIGPLILQSNLIAAAPVTILRDDMTYQVNSDATYTYEETLRLQINDAEGAKEQAQFPLLYSESLQTLNVLEAYTTTKDGQQLQVPADRIFTQELPASTNAPSFSDQKVKMVIYPQVEPGSVLTLRFKKTQLKPVFPGVFSVREVFPRTAEYEGAKLTIRAPAELPLQVSADGLTGGISSTNNPPGTKEWHWELPPTGAILEEPGAVDVADVSPNVVATTLKDYSALASAYMTGARPAAQVSRAIQNVADQATATMTDTRAQAEALYNWVSKNIRYVGVYLGAGGYVPHSATEVLNSRYGDCKDHVTLLEALLAAKGIASSPVIVNAANSYHLPRLATLSAFNHVITFIPKLDLFVDSTARYAPFGVLSETLRGKTALVAQPSDGKPVMVVLPLDVSGNLQSTYREVLLSADGSLSGKSVTESRGSFELVTRSTFGNLAKERSGQIVAAQLRRAGQAGTGDLLFGDPLNLSEVFAIEVQFHVPNFAQLPGPGALNTVPGIASPINLEEFVRTHSQTTRSMPFVCSSGRIVDRIKLTLPDNVKVTALPAPVASKSKSAKYVSRYEQVGQIITINRELELSHSAVPCLPEDYRELYALGIDIGKDLHAPVLFK